MPSSLMAVCRPISSTQTEMQGNSTVDLVHSYQLDEGQASCGDGIAKSFVSAIHTDVNIRF